MTAPLPTLRRRKRRKQRKRERALKRGQAAAARRIGKAIRAVNRAIKAAKARLVIDWNGHEPIPMRHRKQRKAVRYVLRKVPGLYVSSTFRPDSDTYHGPGLGPWAVDFGSSGPGEEPERKAHRLLLEKFGASAFLELFGPDNVGWVKNGSVYTASEGEYLETLHDNHVHAVLR